MWINGRSSARGNVSGAGHWSKDGKSLYYTFDVVDPCRVFDRQSSLYRLDLESGATTLLLPETVLWLSFASEGDVLAYALRDNGALSIVFHHLETGKEEKVVVIENLDWLTPYAVGFSWSPDGEWLAATVIYNTCDWSWKERVPSSVFLIERDSLQKVVVLYEDRLSRLVDS